MKFRGVLISSAIALSLINAPHIIAADTCEADYGTSKKTEICNSLSNTQKTGCESLFATMFAECTANTNKDTPVATAAIATYTAELATCDTTFGTTAKTQECNTKPAGDQAACKSKYDADVSLCKFAAVQKKYAEEKKGWTAAATTQDATAGAGTPAPENRIPIAAPKLSIPFPALPKLTEVNTPTEQGSATTIPWIGEYFAVAYQYFVGLAVILAIILIMVGGLQWSASAGSSEKVSAAKKRITDALMGLTLALGSYMILYTINPALVQFKGLVISSIQGEKWEEVSPAHQSDEETGTSGSASGSKSVTAQEFEANNKMIQEKCDKSKPSAKFVGTASSGKMNYTYLGQSDCIGVKGTRDLKASGKNSGVTLVVLHEGGPTKKILSAWERRCIRTAGGECYGSHFNIEPDGTIHQLAGIEKYVSHGNKTNTYSIGIDLDVVGIHSGIITQKCVPDEKKKGTSREEAYKTCTANYTDAQMQSIANLIKDLSAVTEIKVADKSIIGHCMVGGGTHADPRGFDFEKLGKLLGITMSNDSKNAVSNLCSFGKKHFDRVDDLFKKYYKN